MTEEASFKRQALYEEIWTDPVSTVSKRYNISDNGLRKICQKLGVPLPPLGYWAKLRAGHKMTRTPLRKHTGPTTVRASPGMFSRRIPVPADQVEAIQSIEQEEADPANRIVPASDGVWRHRLVRAVERRLHQIDDAIAEDERPRKKGERGELRLSSVFGVKKPGGLIDPGDDFLPVIVTPSLRQRALSVADAFLVAVEARGFKVRIEAQHTIVSHVDVVMSLRISEMTEKVRKGYGHDASDALGRLRLILRRTDYEVGIPSEVRARDEPGNPLEDQFNQVIAKLRRATLGYTERETARKIARRAAEEERVSLERLTWHEEMATAAARREKEQFDLVLAEADMWDSVERRRRYLEHIEQAARDRGVDVTDVSPIGDWLARARNACRILDPTENRISGLDKASG